MVRPNFAESTPTKKLVAQMTPMKTRNPKRSKRPNMHLAKVKRLRKNFLSEPKLDSTDSEDERSFYMSYKTNSKPSTPMQRKQR